MRAETCATTRGERKPWGLKALTWVGLVSVFLWTEAALGAAGPRSVADLAEKLQGAVVNISTTQTIKPSRGVPLPKIPKGSPFEEFFRDFFDRQQKPNPPRRVNSLGSGFVIDASGLIVTNYHVIKGADEIIVNFSDGTKLKVDKVIGRDPKTDLALLKVTPKKPLRVVRFGDSAKIRVGDWVMAIGNPFGLGGTVTVGIVSAKKRDINNGDYDEFIQTDAAINRGNSGGPLFNMEGEVVGVNTAIISPTGGSIGIGFSIPSNTARYVIAQLRKYGEVRRGWIGVRIQSLSEDIAESLGMAEAKGALVASVVPGGPAQKAGLEVGDVILAFDGKAVPDKRTLPRLVARTPIGKRVKIDLLRGGETRSVWVRVGRTPTETKTGKLRPSPLKMRKTALLGMHLSELTEALRLTYYIGEKIQGVLITKVLPGSVAARKHIRPGNVIIEVTEVEVNTPADVEARIAEVRKRGRKSVLLLISDKRGAMRFIALPITK